MQLPKQKTWVIFSLMCFSLFAGTFFNFIIHEFSHLTTMLLCNGAFESIQFGTASYIGGYINSKYISIVAMSSLICPTLIVMLLTRIKRFYVNIFLIGFNFPNIVNATLGIFATCCINDSTRQTYDVALAYDHTNIKWLIIVTTIIILIINLYYLLTRIKMISNIKQDG